MYDFYSFIDSKAIREYNRDRVFTPAEQAIIITYCKKRTLDEKIAALEYLYHTYTEDAFGTEMIGFIEDELLEPFRATVKAYIDKAKQWLDDRSLTEGYIYTVTIRELYHGIHDAPPLYFSDYQSALAYLQSERGCIRDQEVAEYIFIIRRMEVNTGRFNGATYYFDSKLQLIDTDILPLYKYYVCIPLPFKKGDLVRNINCFSEEYGSIFALSDCDIKPEQIDKLRECGCGMEMCLWGYTYCNECFSDTELFPLELDDYDPQNTGRIPPQMKLLSAALDENCTYDLMDLMMDHFQEWPDVVYRANYYFAEKRKK